MKKSSAKNFLAERFLGVFKKSTLDRDFFSVERFTFILSGCEASNSMALCPSEKVFGFAFFKKRMGFGATPHKNGVFFLQSFFFCAFCAKRKSDVGVDVSLSQEFRVAFLKKAPQKTFQQERFWAIFQKKYARPLLVLRRRRYSDNRFILLLYVKGWI